MRNWGAGDGAVGDACQRRRYGGLRPASPVSGEGYSKRSACGRSSALTRRGAVLLHARVNCAPAKGCVWPVLAPAQAWVRAGGRGTGKFGMRNWVGMGLAARFCRGGLLRLTPGFAFLSRRFALGSRPALRFCRGVLTRFTPVFFLLEEKETACDSLRSCSAGSRSPFARSPVSARLSALAGSLRVCAFFAGDLDGVPGCGGRGTGRRRGACASLRNRIGFAMLSAGSTLGLRAPDCAKESSTLWTLFRSWPSERVRFTPALPAGADSRLFRLSSPRRASGSGRAPS